MKILYNENERNQVPKIDFQSFLLSFYYFTHELYMIDL